MSVIFLNNVANMLLKLTKFSMKMLVITAVMVVYNFVTILRRFFEKNHPFLLYMNFLILKNHPLVYIEWVVFFNFIFSFQ